MSRSKRKNSARRKSPAGTADAASPAVSGETIPAMPDSAAPDVPSAPAAASSASGESMPAASPEGAPSAAPALPVTLPLPGDVPPASHTRPSGVSGLTCAFCCGICLLGGLLLGNLLPHMFEGKEGEAAPARSVAPAAGTPAPAAAQEKTAETPPPVNASREQLEHIGHLEKSLAADPQDAARWAELGNAYFDTQQALKAIDAYERSLALQPGNPNVLTDLGIMYREVGQYERALSSFDQAMRADPAHENSRFNKGVVLLFDLHRHAEAKAVWQELLRLNPRATAPDGTGLRALIEQCDKPLGKASERKGGGTTAAPAAGQQKAPVTPSPANVSRAQQEHIGHLEKSLAAKPQDAARWAELGNVYFDTQQFLKAIDAYERSLALRPGNPNVLTDLGIMYREVGQYQRALTSFDQAMRADPAHENSRFNKGVVLLFDLHRHAEAKAVWQELLRLNPRATAPDGTGLRTLIEQCDKPLP